MTKINWNRTNPSSRLDREYYTNPRTGFDKLWHQTQAKANKSSRKKNPHDLHKKQNIKGPFGPHAGKQICLQCDGAFVTWLPKKYFK